MLRYKYLSVLLCFACLSDWNLSAQSLRTEVYYVTLDENVPVSGKPIQKYLSEHAGVVESEAPLRLFPEFSYQTMKGIGGCFNEIGGIALSTLPESEQNEIMGNLFSPANAAFTFCRTAIGSSDFGADAYSYAGIPEDYDMKHFSVSRDEKALIPYIQKALAYNPDLFLFASPWSPPGWMKESGEMVWGSSLKDSPEIYRGYALYLWKYVEEYAKHGIPIRRLLVQNETDCKTNYPSCIFPPAQMINFVKNYLGPHFQHKHAKTEIWGGTYRVVKDGGYEALSVFSDPGFRKYAKGVGMQYQDYNHLIDFRLLYPNIPLMHTESECFGGENSIEQAYDRLAEISKYVEAGSENFTYWNMILDETNESGWGWKQNSLITIDRTSGEVTYHPDYAVMALISHFVRPGDKRIAHLYWEGPTFAVQAPDGKNKVFVVNREAESKSVVLRISGCEDVSVNIPPHSLSVIISEIE